MNQISLNIGYGVKGRRVGIKLAVEAGAREVPLLHSLETSSGDTEI